MGESSKKKRTLAKSLSTRKIVEAARSILKKKETKSKKSVKKADTAPKAQTKISKENVDMTFFGGPVMQKFMGDKKYEIPAGYGDTRITVMVRDPHWLHAYWEVPGWKVQELVSLIGKDNFGRSRKILRVHDVTDKLFDGSNANASFDIGIAEESKNWYIQPGGSNKSYCVDIGYLGPDGKFYLMARSNVVSTPREGMSEVIDEEWMTIDWERMYALSGGFGVGRSSGEIREILKKRLREEMSSGMFSSWSRNIHEVAGKEKDFWLVVNTELIVYGATQPDAKVSVQGLPIKLRPDGTFTLRFALPDGRQEIPVVAVNKDGDMKRAITPEVEKRTK